MTTYMMAAHLKNHTGRDRFSKKYINIQHLVYFTIYYLVKLQDGDFLIEAGC